MDIVVSETSKISVKPNKVVIEFDFVKEDKSYDKVLELGVNSVNNFISTIMEHLKLNKELLKTRNFRIYQNKKYDYEKKEQIDLGFVYSQHAKLELDYDMEIVAKLMESISKSENAPKYTINFGVKNDDEIKSQALKEAYKLCESKAKAIADAAGKNLKCCAKVSFKPFDESLTSFSQINDDVRMYSKERSVRATSDVISDIFVPEDIVVCETLYCLWVAE